VFVCRNNNNFLKNNLVCLDFVKKKVCLDIIIKIIFKNNLDFVCYSFCKKKIKKIIAFKNIASV